LSSEGNPSTIPDEPNEDRKILAVLQGWRKTDSDVSIDSDFDWTIRELPPLDKLIQRSGRMNRDSILGKYSYLGGGTEEFMREKQEELDREDRH
jgi:hypothetical protein